MVDHAYHPGLPGGASPASPGDGDEREWSYGRLSVVTRNSSWRLLLDSLALWGDQIMLLSVAGPETSIKAVHACLASNVPARFESEVEIQRDRSARDRADPRVPPVPGDP